MAWATSRHPGSTRQSRRIREIVLAAWPTCYLGYTGCTIVSIEDDHVVPLVQGGSDDLNNRRGVCRNCHRAKTQAEAHAARTARRTRQPEQHPGRRQA
jgi:5-methylcytosine-specific restriction protein A